jgi:membrane protease YdiL (CAAX protease family)
MVELSEEGKPELDTQSSSDFMVGIGIFLLVGFMFFLVQSYVFIKALVASPDVEGSAFDLSILQDPSLQQHMSGLMENGDVIANVTMWSGIVCSAAILLFVFLWKRGAMIDVLGLRIAPARVFMRWLGIFVLVIVGIELLGLVLPDLQSDFMRDIMESVTDRATLIIGIGIMAPIFEELLLRGVLLYSVERVSNEHIAVALSAFVFTILHLQYEVWIMLLILPLGVVLGYARVRSGSILVPIVLHILNNTGSILLYPYLAQG